MDILSYILTHWVEWFFALCLAILTAAWRATASRIKVEQKKNEAIAEGVQCLLRETIVQNYNKYKDKGYCPIWAKESMKKAYHAYHDGLLGNDVATGLYKELLAMPTEKGGSNEAE